MSSTEQGIGQCTSSYEAQVMLSITSDLLAPAYIFLSLVAIASRYIGILRLLASHGKTASKSTTMTESRTHFTLFWVSKRHFVHFYLVGLFSAAVVTSFQWNSSRMTVQNPMRTAAIILLTLHLLRRTYECAFVQQFRGESSKMHIAGYALGVGYYAVLPLVFLDMSTVAEQAIPIERGIEYDYGEDNLFAILMNVFSQGICVIGTICFNLWMQYEQHIHHDILASIRRNTLPTHPRDDSNPEATSNHEKDKSADVEHCNYSLPPRQRWFRYVLSPHYLAEILLYFSFVILLEFAVRSQLDMKHDGAFWYPKSGRISDMKGITSIFYSDTIQPFLVVGGRYRHWTLLFWVATNLIVSAINSYDWYRTMFETDSEGLSVYEVGRKRKAIIPGLL